ncbi:WG repeat-containing protein [Sphingomonas arantia]|uniref:WG repeat-containing protein n=2 Tax=Sphingomonas arantia TaxID=1460676 RepID=A0ABW4TY49_9SPHN
MQALPSGHGTPRCGLFAGAALLLAALPSGVWAQGGGGSPSFPLACAFIDRGGELQNADYCGAETAEGMVVAPAVSGALGYRGGLASFAVTGRGWYYRRRDGVTREMVTFDNGPDEFVEGLARAKVDGKLAYVDRRLRIRVRTRYDWGDRFANGRAAVCVGCVATMVDGGEHRMMTGGRWGVIDRRGREVVAVNRSERPSGTE